MGVIDKSKIRNILITIFLAFFQVYFYRFISIYNQYRIILLISIQRFFCSVISIIKQV